MADKLVKTSQHLDEEENINVEVYTLEEIKCMIFDGTIKDSKTISAVWLILSLFHRNKANCYILIE